MRLIKPTSEAGVSLYVRPENRDDRFVHIRVDMHGDRGGCEVRAAVQHAGEADTAGLVSWNLTSYEFRKGRPCLESLALGAGGAVFSLDVRAGTFHKHQPCEAYGFEHSLDGGIETWTVRAFKDPGHTTENDALAVLRVRAGEPWYSQPS